MISITFAPPVMVIRVPCAIGSFGYGAKIDGNKICIPYNPAVVKHLQERGVEMQFATGTKIPLNVVAMARVKFNKLPDCDDSDEGGRDPD